MNVNVEKKVIECIKGPNFGLWDEEVSVGDELVRDLGFDSIDHVELAMILEKAFDITLPDVEINEWKTVKDVVSNVEKYLQCGKVVDF